MGNAQSFGPPDQFVVQSRSDFDKQMKKVLTHRPTVIKTVVLPPGVQLTDPRLQHGEVVDEKQYQLEVGDYGEWPTNAPFEVDVEKDLVPPCWGKAGVQAHYAIYPDTRFKGSRCGLCELTNRSRGENQKQWNSQ